MRPYAQIWVDSNKHDAMVRSAAKLLQFAFDDPDVTIEHQTHLIRDALWSVTEMDGKYTTRYRSQAVLDLERDAADPLWRSRLRHDHVVTRKSLAERLRKREDPEAVLREALACVVTKEEHDRLSSVDSSIEGWYRYRAAGVDVVDMSTRQPFDLPE